jgi:hypothetical protein
VHDGLQLRASRRIGVDPWDAEGGKHVSRFRVVDGCCAGCAGDVSRAPGQMPGVQYVEVLADAGMIHVGRDLIVNGLRRLAPSGKNVRIRSTATPVEA